MKYIGVISFYEGYTRLLAIDSLTEFTRIIRKDQPFWAKLFDAEGNQIRKPYKRRN